MMVADRHLPSLALETIGAWMLGVLWLLPLLYAAFYLSIAIAAVAGGTVHGFFLDESSRGHSILWPFTLIGVGLTHDRAQAVHGGKHQRRKGRACEIRARQKLNRAPNSPANDLGTITPDVVIKPVGCRNVDVRMLPP